MVALTSILTLLAINNGKKKDLPYVYSKKERVGYSLLMIFVQLVLIALTVLSLLFAVGLAASAPFILVGEYFVLATMIFLFHRLFRRETYYKCTYKEALHWALLYYAAWLLVGIVYVILFFTGGIPFM